MRASRPTENGGRTYVCAPTWKRYAPVVQWQNAALPRRKCGFDSRPALHKAAVKRAVKRERLYPDAQPQMRGNCTDRDISG